MIQTGPVSVGGSVRSVTTSWRARHEVSTDEGGSVPVQDWLVRYTGEDVTWQGVIGEFYRRAAEEPAIASYFTGVDLERLIRHFSALMVMVTSSGVSAATVQRMTIAHAGVVDAAGAPINGTVYDRVIGVLVQVLTDAGVPGSAIDELAHTVGPLRAAIVAED